MRRCDRESTGRCEKLSHEYNANAYDDHYDDGEGSDNEDNNDRKHNAQNSDNKDDNVQKHDVEDFNND